MDGTFLLLLTQHSSWELHVHCNEESSLLKVVVIIRHPFSTLFDDGTRPSHLIT